MVLKTHFFIKMFCLLYRSFVSLIRISRNIKQKLTAIKYKLFKIAKKLKL